MLTFNFTRIFKSRGIDNYATRIVNNKIERLTLKDIEKLCELFQCTPNDFLEWIPGSNDLKNENHPLSSLKRSDKVVQLTKILNSVPLDKLADIETMINEKIRK
jgi:DNA-binding Xre family transcriptional regulator